MPKFNIPVVFVEPPSLPTKLHYAAIGSVQDLQHILGETAMRLYHTHHGTPTRMTLHGLPIEVKANMETLVALAAMEIPGYKAVMFHGDTGPQARVVAVKNEDGTIIDHGIVDEA